MLNEYNLKFSKLLAEKEMLIKKLRAEKRVLQEGKHFIKENITSRYEEIIEEKETLMREKVEQIGNLQTELITADTKEKDLEQNIKHLKSLLESRLEELNKMKDFNMENIKLKRENVENDRKIRALEERLQKEVAKNKNLQERKYEKHLEEIDKIVEKCFTTVDGSINDDIAKKLQELQESFVSKEIYEAEIRKREKESFKLKEKLTAEERNVSDLIKESRKLKCYVEKLTAELETCKKELDDARTRLGDEESIQKGEVGSPCLAFNPFIKLVLLLIGYSRLPDWRRLLSSSRETSVRWRNPRSVSVTTVSSSGRKLMSTEH